MDWAESEPSPAPVTTIAWRLDEDRLRAPLGPGGGAGYTDHPMAGLVLYVSREVMHHGGEIGVLRDLYRASDAGRHWPVARNVSTVDNGASRPWAATQPSG
jgi:hypothetical protein